MTVDQVEPLINQRVYESSLGGGDLVASVSAPVDRGHHHATGPAHALCVFGQARGRCRARVLERPFE